MIIFTFKEDWNGGVSACVGHYGGEAWEAMLHQP